MSQIDHCRRAVSPLAAALALLAAAFLFVGLSACGSRAAPEKPTDDDPSDRDLGDGAGGEKLGAKPAVPAGDAACDAPVAAPAPAP
jgi:hypothetical protein